MGDEYNVYPTCPSPAFSDISTNWNDDLDMETIIPFHCLGKDCIEMEEKSPKPIETKDMELFPPVGSLLSSITPIQAFPGNNNSDMNNNNSSNYNNNNNNDKNKNKNNSDMNTNTNNDDDSDSENSDIKNSNNKDITDNNHNNRENNYNYNRRGCEDVSSPAKCRSPSISVEFENLQDTYFKVQKRTLFTSEQRLVNAHVSMTSTATVPIQCIHVFVKRCENGGPDVVGEKRPRAHTTL